MLCYGVNPKQIDGRREHIAGHLVYIEDALDQSHHTTAQLRYKLAVHRNAQLDADSVLDTTAARLDETASELRAARDIANQVFYSFPENYTKATIISTMHALWSFKMALKRLGYSVAHP